MFPKLIHFFIIMAFISLSVSSIQAQTLEYEQDNIETLQIETKVRNLISNGTRTIPLSPMSQEPLPDIQKSKQIIYADFPEKKWLTQLYLHRKDFTDDDFPTEIHFCDFNNSTIIDNLKQKVIISPFRPESRNGTNILWAGRIHAGRSLANIIHQTSDSIQSTDEPNRYALTIGPPHFTPPQFPEPIKIILNSNNQVVELIEQQRHFYFTWDETENGFPYVKRSLMHTSKKSLYISLEIQVDQIQLNPTLPEGIFEVDYPEHFHVVDTRNLLTPFEF